MPSGLSSSPRTARRTGWAELNWDDGRRDPFCAFTLKTKPKHGFAGAMTTPSISDAGPLSCSELSSKNQHYVRDEGNFGRAA
jgi:hypothetical protein